MPAVAGKRAPFVAGNLDHRDGEVARLEYHGNRGGNKPSPETRLWRVGLGTARVPNELILRLNDGRSSAAKFLDK